MPKAKVSTDTERWYEKRERDAAARSVEVIAKVGGKGKPTPKPPNRRQEGPKPYGCIRRRAASLRGRRDNRRRLMAVKGR